MKSVFIIKEEQVFECSHWTQRTGHFVNKIKVVSSRKEKQEYQNKGFYKFSLWERFKFFGFSLLPEERQRYDILPLKNGKYDIRKI